MFGDGFTSLSGSPAFTSDYISHDFNYMQPEVATCSYSRQFRKRLHTATETSQTWRFLLGNSTAKTGKYSSD